MVLVNSKEEELSLNPLVIEEATKEFREKFMDGVRAPLDGRLSELERIEAWFVSIFTRFGQQEYERGRNERQIRDDVPMGVSQWKNHGDKWHYTEFWKEKIRKEEQETAVDLVFAGNDAVIEAKKDAYAHAIKDAIMIATEQFVDEGWQTASGDPDIRRENIGENEGVRSVIRALHSLLPNHKGQKIKE